MRAYINRTSCKSAKRFSPVQNRFLANVQRPAHGIQSKTFGTHRDEVDDSADRCPQSLENRRLGFREHSAAILASVQKALAVILGRIGSVWLNLCTQAIWTPRLKQLHGFLLGKSGLRGSRYIILREDCPEPS